MTSPELLPEEKVWTIMASALKFNPKTSDWDEIEVEYLLLVCPNLECGNADTSRMKIYSTDLDTSAWWGTESRAPLDKEIPVFEYGKSVYTESSDIPDDAECLVCGTQWQVSPASHYYDFG